MIRFVVYGFIVILSLCVLFASDISNVSFVLASGFLVGFAVPIVDAAVVNARYLKIAYYSIRIGNKRVRVSASYLYRIRIDGRYLLVKGKRFDQYQPVGGVYKRHPSSAGRLGELKVLDDDLLAPDAVSMGDLRVRLPGRKLLAFVRWFDKGTGREVDGWREFFEELIATGILTHDAFRYISYDFVDRYYHHLRYSQWAGSKELLIADILELLPTPAQEQQLRDLISSDRSVILWATEEQIRRRGAQAGLADQQIRIAEHAAWTI